MKKLNKNGFTLVELLAVIVILALLIVVVANSVLPALNNSKQSALKTYAQRVIQAAKSNCMSAVMLNGGATDSDANKASCGKNGTAATDKLNHASVMGVAATEYSVAIYVTKSGDKYSVTGCVGDKSGNVATIAGTNGNETVTVSNTGKCADGTGAGT